jgi:serine/threonine protein kinase
VDKSIHYQKALRREIEMMKYMNHPNIIRLYDALKDDRFLYLMLEYSCIGDLEKYIRTKPGQKLTQEETHHFMQEIGTFHLFSFCFLLSFHKAFLSIDWWVFVAKALKFLRSHNIVHRFVIKHITIKH